jgi:hypothetical protein
MKKPVTKSRIRQADEHEGGARVSIALPLLAAGEGAPLWVHGAVRGSRPASARGDDGERSDGALRSEARARSRADGAPRRERIGDSSGGFGFR